MEFYAKAVMVKNGSNTNVRKVLHMLAVEHVEDRCLNEN